jgi:hypothetical protein
MLGEDAGGAQGWGEGRIEIGQIVEFGRIEQVGDIADELMTGAQVIDAEDRGPGEIDFPGVELQRVIGQLARDQRPGLGAREQDRQIRLAPGGLRKPFEATRSIESPGCARAKAPRCRAMIQLPKPSDTLIRTRPRTSLPAAGSMAPAARAMPSTATSSASPASVSCCPSRVCSNNVVPRRASRRRRRRPMVVAFTPLACAARASWPWRAMARKA